MGPLHALGGETLQLAVLIEVEALGRDAVFAGVLLRVRSDLEVAVVGALDASVLRPRVVRRASGRRFGKQLEVLDRLGAMANSSADAVVS